MGFCGHCGKQTSWPRRVRSGGQEFCDASCRNEWTIAAATAARAEREKKEEAQRAEQRAKEKAQKEVRRAEQEARRAEKEALRAEKEARRKAEEDRHQKWEAQASPLLEEIQADPRDPYLRLRLAALANRAGQNERAEELYVDALSLGIPNPRDSGFAKWNYAKLLWHMKGASAWPWSNPRRPPGLGNTKPFADGLRDGKLRRVFEGSAGHIIHYLREADRDLRRHLRSAPDDLEALTTLFKIAPIIGKETAPVEEQIKQMKRRRSLLGVKGQGPSGRTLTGDRTGIAFENLCLSLVTQLGFRAELTKATSDGGIDIIAFRDQPLTRGKYIIQCKDWANPVGEPILRDLLGAVSAEDAVKGILITSGGFTDGARRFAEGKRLELIDGRDLESLTAQSDTET